MTNRTQESENKMLANLIGCANDLCGLDLVIEDHPDRATPFRKAIEHGCDAILAGSRIPHKIAVQVGEVPISEVAYAQNVRLRPLRNYLLPRMTNAFPGHIVEVVVHSETLQKFFDPEPLGDRIMEAVKGLADTTGLERYRFKTIWLPCDVRIDVLKKLSDFPHAAINCGLSSENGFDHSFKRVLQKKCRQFRLYGHDHLSCVVLWSSDVCNVGETLVVDAFRSADVEVGHINSIWFIHATGVPTVFPLYSEINDCRKDPSCIWPFYWWQDRSRPFKTIPQPFGHAPTGMFGVSDQPPATRS